MSKFICKTLSIIGFWCSVEASCAGQAQEDVVVWQQLCTEIVGEAKLAQTIWQDSLLQQHLYQGMMFLHDSAQQTIAGSYYSLGNVEKFSQTIQNYISNRYPQHRELIMPNIARFWEELHATNATISKKLQTVELEECILVSNNYATLYWASHYELLADTISNTVFDTTTIRKTLANYAAERIFTDQNYPFQANLEKYLKEKNILYISNIPKFSTPYARFYADYSNAMADGLRQVPPSTWAIWNYMLGGLVVGIVCSIIYHQFYWKKHTSIKKDL